MKVVKLLLISFLLTNCASKKEIKTESVPSKPTKPLPAFLPKKILARKPKNGANTNTKAKFFSISIYPFKFFLQYN